ncbi:MAG: hypothetical protein U5O39_14515 [Gammaproteobacteria bacterium]|nr:hypothetical protein [Gammaproteobacteria bacterium]
MSDEEKTPLSTLTDLLDRLDEEEIRYSLESIREGAVLVTAAVEGERWEIEFLASGDVEIEIFKSNGDLYDLSALEDLFED